MGRKLLFWLLILTMIIPSTIISSAYNIVTSNDYTSEQLSCDSYDVQKYISPFWEGNIVYNEVVYPLTNQSGEIEPVTLLYDVSEIVTVKNYNLNVTYEEGKDYNLVDGKLVINPTGAIKIHQYSYIHPQTKQDSLGYNGYFPHRNGQGYEYYSESSEFSNESICVTYIHNDTWHSVIPDNNTKNLPNTINALINKEPLSVVLTGDSISVGASSSGFLGISPYADAYPDLAVKGLQYKYNYRNIILHNSALGGAISSWTPEKLDTDVIQYNPNLVIIAFGMNDASVNFTGLTDEEFESNIRGRIEYIRDFYPDCEFLLIVSIYGNEKVYDITRFESHAKVLYKIASDTEGVGICDPQRIEKGIFESGRKSFIDLMANNMVHPNDMGMRLIAQTIVESLSVDITQYRDVCIDELSVMASLESHLFDEKYNTLDNLLTESITKLNASADLDQIVEIYNEYKGKIEIVLKECTPNNHLFSVIEILPTCENDGYNIEHCNICGFEQQLKTIPSMNKKHVWDEGRITKTPDYRTTGEKVYTCALCNFEKKELLPKSFLEEGEDNVLHIEKGLNYMERTSQIFEYDSGCIELDVCPLDINMDGEFEGDISYVGFFIGNYSKIAAYNFSDQRFEIVSLSLPNEIPKTTYATKLYKWDIEQWHKFGIKLVMNTIYIYCDGELVLQDTNQGYASETSVPVVFTVGEFDLDNIAYSKRGYDPTTGKGAKTMWDFNSSESISSFDSLWKRTTYPGFTYISAYGNPSTGHYLISEHDHHGRIINSLEATCIQNGWDECICDICGGHFFINYREKLANEHSLSKIIVIESPSVEHSGKGICYCVTCNMSFSTEIPFSSVVLGDANGDGKVNAVDSILICKYIVGLNSIIDETASDINVDGKINSIDVSLISVKLIAGLG